MAASPTTRRATCKWATWASKWIPIIPWTRVLLPKSDKSMITSKTSISTSSPRARTTWASRWVTMLLWICQWRASPTQRIHIRRSLCHRGRSTANSQRSNSDSSTKMCPSIKSSTFRISPTRWATTKTKRSRSLASRRAWASRRIWYEHIQALMNIQLKQQVKRILLAWIQSKRMKSLKYSRIEYSKHRLMTMALWKPVAYLRRRLEGETQVTWPWHSRPNQRWCKTWTK